MWLTEDDFACRPRQERGTKIEVDLEFHGLSETERAMFFEIVDFDAENPAKSKATIHFEADWPKGRKRPSIRRWGGPPNPDRSQVPPEILERLPVTFLPALRDAAAALTPGYRSRLAPLFRQLADRETAHPRDTVVDIFSKANDALTKLPFIKQARKTLQANTREMAGTDYQSVSVATAEPEFDRILRTLCLTMDGAAVQSIASNGLGYNNLLYIATVLTHLSRLDDDECPILLVEEPEAHLHPQLTLLLGRFLAETRPGGTPPQTIITTHSPTLASSVKPRRIHVLFQEPEGSITCNSLSGTGLDLAEERKLQRMTLEYDLAVAGPANPGLMAEVWESCFQGQPRTLNRHLIAEAGETLEEQALAVWRGICRAEHSGSKADFAHRLAERLENRSSDGQEEIEFAVPEYIRRAIEHVVAVEAEPQEVG